MIHGIWEGDINFDESREIFNPVSAILRINTAGLFGRVQESGMSGSNGFWSPSTIGRRPSESG